MITMENRDLRAEAIRSWLRQDLCLPLQSFAPASSDASFRRYFRAIHDGKRHIVMDAPPERENIAAFVKIARLFKQVPVNVPDIISADSGQGFLLLEDFGNQSYLDVLNAANAEELYGQALQSLWKLQTGIDVGMCDLPRYDDALLRRELGIFREWYLGGLLALDFAAELSVLLDDLETVLIVSALAQPQVCVHRDYHARNLMYTGAGEPGILDFQDAVIGPVTYDLVSLLKDCYIAWPEAQVAGWMLRYYQRLFDAGIVTCGAEVFTRWFDLMGMQRHLKAIGIFARLHLRDGKPSYLRDIPRTLGYVAAVSARYPMFAGFHEFLQRHVLPAKLPS